ncbi:hypothetical protein RFI_07357 [Reticulomyxa filosa]|uniref:Uncharacterized protein n=1 Tax=Reticulomyxa filosa TaxID=46433 RepID=X6NVD1_RETFI|nr:hypothetical protein RFI_07357 [Reticulomyxa filosa]|eukprot:ETO29764.1 hypothetical protein RFI_07357 [Reticulomyxa filosa]
MYMYMYTYAKGGQRAERKKWIHCFTGVTAVIFVASLSGYEESMYEEETENVMHDSLNLFTEVCNRSYFHTTPIILFLNKDDLFRAKINTESPYHVPLTVCFPEYDGKDEYDDCLGYIKKQFTKCHARTGQNHKIFIHVTCAMDSNNVRRVFDDVTHIVIQRSLNEVGFM